MDSFMNRDDIINRYAGLASWFPCVSQCYVLIDFVARRNLFCNIFLQIFATCFFIVICRVSCFSRSVTG